MVAQMTQIRRPKPEIRTNSEARMTKTNRCRHFSSSFWFRHSSFTRISGFVIRISSPLVISSFLINYVHAFPLGGPVHCHCLRCDVDRPVPTNCARTTAACHTAGGD